MSDTRLGPRVSADPAHIVRAVGDPSDLKVNPQVESALKHGASADAAVEAVASICYATLTVGEGAPLPSANRRAEGVPLARDPERASVLVDVRRSVVPEVSGAPVRARAEPIGEPLRRVGGDCRPTGSKVTLKLTADRVALHIQGWPVPQRLLGLAERRPLVRQPSVDLGQLLAQPLDVEAGLPEGRLGLAQLRAVEAPAERVVMVVDDLKGLVPRGGGGDESVGQLGVALGGSGDLAAVPDDPRLGR